MEVMPTPRVLAVPMEVPGLPRWASCGHVPLSFLLWSGASPSRPELRPLPLPGAALSRVCTVG